MREATNRIHPYHAGGGWGGRNFLPPKHLRVFTPIILYYLNNIKNLFRAQNPQNRLKQENSLVTSYHSPPYASLPPSLPLMSFVPSRSPLASVPVLLLPPASSSYLHSLMVSDGLRCSSSWMLCTQTGT